MLQQFGKDKTRLIIRYPEGKKDLDYTIPDGVTWIGESAPRNSPALARLTIPANVVYIEKDAFYNCSRRVQITLLTTVPPE